MGALLLATIWCGVLLGEQVLRTRDLGRRPLFAPAAGSAAAGVRYAFTWALAPEAKESVRRHRLDYAAGLTLHAGVAASFVLLFWPARVLGGLALAGAMAGLGLLARRILIQELRGLSHADDYASNLLATGFAFCAGLSPWLGAAAAATPWAAAALLFYLPLGKLRHAAFFFLSRWHLGAFFGRRGVFPA